MLLLIGLSGCASGADIADVDLSNREPGCARQCLATYSECAGNASMARGTVNTGSILSACKASLRACGTTCPAR